MEPIFLNIFLIVLSAIILFHAVRTYKNSKRLFEKQKLLLEVKHETERELLRELKKAIDQMEDKEATQILVALIFTRNQKEREELFQTLFNKIDKGEYTWTEDDGSSTRSQHGNSTSV